MTDRERTALRRLQDKFLALPIVREFVRTHGETYPLWEGGPTTDEVRRMIHPNWRETFLSYLP